MIDNQICDPRYGMQVKVTFAVLKQFLTTTVQQAQRNWGYSVIQNHELCDTANAPVKYQRNFFLVPRVSASGRFDCTNWVMKPLELLKSNIGNVGMMSWKDMNQCNNNNNI